MDTCRFKNGTNSTAGNKTGTFNRRFQHYIPCTKFTENFMRNAHFRYRNTLHVFTRLINSLPDRIGNLISLTKTATNFSFTITHNYNGAEAKTSATLDYFRSPIDMHDLFNKLVIATYVLIKICQGSPPNRFGIFYRDRYFFA